MRQALKRPVFVTHLKTRHYFVNICFGPLAKEAEPKRTMIETSSAQWLPQKFSYSIANSYFKIVLLNDGAGGFTEKVVSQ
jgi:hypothetical protein